MSKRIILLSDGTGNSAAKIWRTNVWRTFESLDLTQPDQVAIYDDGVGSSSFKPAAILGGAFGIGLKRNVLSLYKFLCRNYKSAADYEQEGIASPDDEIFAFGFSRGAFTVRVLVGFVLEQGLVRFQTEEQLSQKAKAAYRAYREKKYKTNIGTEIPFRMLRNLFVSASHDETQRPVGQIRFLGLWDTVAAYGLPVEEMTYGISRYVWPLELPNCQLDDRVQRACHALSLDDERTTFHPVLWNETGIAAVRPNADGIRLTSNEVLSQVWFPGVHANVGGGYPDDSLAHVSLNWMLKEASDCRLRFKTAPPADPDAIVALQSRQDSDGRLYDSRNGLGGYYRYGPRNVADLSDLKLSHDPRDRVSIETPKIHESVFTRLKNNAHNYAPLSLPERYEIVTSQTAASPDPKIVSPAALPYESPDQALARYAHQENIVWSFVWRRRIVYFLTVIASLHLAFYPLNSALSASAELETRLRFVSDLIRLVAVVLPSALERWVKVYAGDPASFLIAAGTVAGLIWISSRIKVRITDEMSANWKASLANSSRVRLRRGTLSPFSFGALDKAALAILLFVAAYRPLFWALPSIRELLWPSLHDLLDRATHGFIWALIVATLITLLLPTSAIAKFRTGPRYKQTIRRIKRKYLPAAFAIVLPLIALAFANHSIANIRDGFGQFCEATEAAGVELGVAKKFDIDTGKLCNSTGIFLKNTEKYRLVVDQGSEKWEFAGVPSSTAGMPLAEFLAQRGESSIKGYLRWAIMFAMSPLKRTLDRPWGRVIVRYGSTGNEEEFIDPGNETTTTLRVEILQPKRDGELFIYLNKPTLAFWPQLLDGFNSGIAHITVTRMEKK